MTVRVKPQPFSGSLAQRLAVKPTEGTVLYWLGQAGFILDMDGVRIVIDPYLSDSLAAKYAGTDFPHVRMMPPPIAVSDIREVDYVLCTHAHTDHMDPGTLPGLLATNPCARLIAPRAVQAAARERSGVGDARISWIDAGERIDLSSGLSLTATRSAHETIKCDEDGRHHYLGFAIQGQNATVWHSGDTVPFEGQVAEVLALAPDVALLPVNGRRAELSERGIAGNLTLQEAIELGEAAGASAVIAHHYGMFAFNTLPPERIDEVINKVQGGLLRAAVGTAYFISSSGPQTFPATHC